MSQPSQFDIARAMLKVHEGLRLTEYTDTTGHNTIGYGWNLDAKALPEGIGKIVDGKLTITEVEAEQLLDMAMLSHWGNLVSALPWVLKLGEWRQAVLLDMAFNMDIPALLTFKNTLKYIETGRYGNASEGMLNSKWASQVKRRAIVLSDIMLNGKMNNHYLLEYGLGGWEHF